MSSLCGAVRRTWGCGLLAAAVVFAVPATTMAAQQTAAAQPAGQTAQPAGQTAPDETNLHTLHVYANLIQLPTLVLDSFFEPVKSRPGLRFQVSLDGGQPFTPTHVRLEGEDSISLAIVLDASGSQNDLLRALPDALRKVAATSLLPHDHVSLYALDCTLARSLNDAPADPAGIVKAVGNVLATPGLHNEGPRHGCASTLKLWNSVAYVVRQMAGLPGRRVVLVVSSGLDKGSTRTWSEVNDDAQRNGVAIFGLSEAGALPVASGGRGANRSVTAVSQTVVYDGPFDSLCQSSGGRILTADPARLGDRLRGFIKLLRGRFILEFPRPDNLPAGAHDIKVTVPGYNFLIHPAGISVPMADPAQPEGTAAGDDVHAPAPEAGSTPGPQPHP